MKVKDLRPRGAISAAPDESLRAAAKHLADDDIGALLVSGSRGPVGVIGERDLARAVADGADLDEVPIEEYMTDSPLRIGDDAAVGEAIAKMNEHSVRHLVVVQGENDVVGMISMRDIFALLGTDWPEL